MVHNDRSVADKNVVLAVTLPEGARFERSINPPMIRATSGSTPDRRTIQFMPIAELRPDESTIFRIMATASQTGSGTFRAEVTSMRSPEPTVVTEETTFFAE